MNDNTRQVSFSIKEELYKDLKIHAVKNNIHLKDILAKAVSDFVKNNQTTS